MALHDHFHPPLSKLRFWEGFHSSWATTIAHELNTLLPPQYFAMAMVTRGPQVEVDVAAFQETLASSSTSQWIPEAPACSVPIVWSERDLFEIRVINQQDTPRLTAAIELISPANKDRPATRRSFAGKCAGYLRQGIGLLIVDVVTNRQHDMHQELLELLELDPPNAEATTATPPLYAVSYRTVVSESTRLDMWPHALAIGGDLPTMPLWLQSDLAVPVNLQSTYVSTCRSLRIE